MPLNTSHQLHAVLQGLDFFFANRQHAVKLVDFLQVFKINDRHSFDCCLAALWTGSTAHWLHVIVM
jgi:hypothetical protein